MRPLRFWTDDAQVNGHPYPSTPTRAPWPLRLLGLVVVAVAVWILIVFASIIAEG